MSDPLAAEPPADSDDSTLHHLRLSILTRLATALDTAALRLQQAAAGQSVFTSDADLKSTLALLKLLPDLLPLLPKPPNLPMSLPTPLIPPCPICGQGPGAHWPDHCPTRKPANPNT